MEALSQKIKKYLPATITLVLIFLILFLLLFNRIVIVIRSGEGGVLYRTLLEGTVTTKVYDEGFWLIFPWDKMYIYNARVQEYSHEFDALTKNGLKVHLNLSVRYRPEYKLLGILHKEVGEGYVHIVVLPEIESVLRVLIGGLDAEEIYTTKQSLLEKAINGAIEQIAQRYVQVDDVIIKKLQLPDSVAESIRKKIEQKHVADAYVFRLRKEESEKERKRIEAEGLERFSKALSPQVLQYMGIQATLELSKSNNTKVVIAGGGQDGGLPIIGSMPLAPFTETIYPTSQNTSETDEEPAEEAEGTESIVNPSQNLTSSPDPATEQ